VGGHAAHNTRQIGAAVHGHALSAENLRVDTADRHHADEAAVLDFADHETDFVHVGDQGHPRPLAGQLEQQANAAALKKLNLALTMDVLDRDILDLWLLLPPKAPARYPNVAREIARWISRGDWNSLGDISGDLWAQLDVLQSTGGKPAYPLPLTIRQPA